MWQNLTVNTKPRPSLCVGLLLCLDVVTCLAYPQQTSKPQEACDARVIAIQGGWVANPVSRSLSNWSCVKAGEDVVLVDGSPSGSITVNYHRGARQPDTTTCRSHAECRNAYRVKSSAVEPDMPQS